MTLKSILKAYTAVQQETKVKDMDMDYSEKCKVRKVRFVDDALPTVKPDLVLQTANTVDLRDGMEQTKKEKSQLSAANRKLSEMEAPLKQKEPKKAVGWASYLGKKVTTALRRLKQKCKFSTKVDLKPRLDGTQWYVSCHKEEEEQMMEMENQKLQNALKETEEELKTQLDQRQRDKSCHLEELEKSRSTFLAPVAIHKTETDQFMDDWLQWEQEKPSLLEEILAACELQNALKETEEELKTQLDQRQCDESCHKEEEEQMMEMENQKLQNALKETEEELKTQLDRRQRDKSCHLEELEKSRSTFLAPVAILKKETDQFMADCLQWEQEKASLLEEIRACCVGQLNEQKMEDQKLQNALKETEEELKTQLDQRQRDKSCHLEELEKSRSTFLAQAAILKKETDQFMDDCLQWEREKPSLLEEILASCELQNALKETEEELKPKLDRRQRDKSCHLEELEKSRSTFLAPVAIHKKERDQFMDDCLQWEQEKPSLLEEILASCELQNAPKETEEELKTQLDRKQRDKSCLLEELEELEKVRSTFLAQVTIDKKETDQFTTDRLQWEQEKGLRNAEQHFEGFQEWRVTVWV